MGPKNAYPLSFVTYRRPVCPNACAVDARVAGGLVKYRVGRAAGIARMRRRVTRPRFPGPRRPLDPRLALASRRLRLRPFGRWIVHRVEAYLSVEGSARYLDRIGRGEHRFGRLACFLAGHIAKATALPRVWP